MKEFCEAVSVPDDADTFEEDEVIDESEIRLWCSSLIRTSPDGKTFEFVHFTVQEFLLEACSTHPTLSFYHVNHEMADLVLGRLCLKYLTFKNYERYPEANNSETLYIAERNNSRPFYEHAAFIWRYFVRDVMENDSIFRLLVVLFDARKSASFQAWALELVRHHLVDDKGDLSYYCPKTGFGKSEEVALTTKSALLRPDFTTLHLAAALALPGICQHLLEHGAEVDIKSRYGTPLHCAVGGLAVFADIDLLRDDFHGAEDVGDHLQEARHRTVQILLGAGASVLSHFSSPFQRISILRLPLLPTIYGTDFMIVGDLIKAGAEVCDEDLDHFQKFVNCERVSYFTDNLEKVLNMGLDVPDQVISHYATLGASQDLVRDFLWNTIKNNDVDALRKFIDSGGLDQVKSIIKLAKDEDWTLLHEAIRSGAVNCFKLLLEVGCPVDIVLPDGRTLAHLCWEDQNEDFLRVLIEHHICTIVQDHELDTIWHLAAASNSTTILRLLLAIEDEKKTALGLKSKDGQTPLRVSLGKGHKESVLILMQHCPSPDFWESEPHLFRDAASIGSAEIVHKLLDVGFGLDPVDANSESPLHSVGPNTSIECATLLVELFPHCQLRTKDHGEIPLEAFLDKASRQWQPVNHAVFEIFKILLTDVDVSCLEYGPHLWQAMCRAIVTAFLDKKEPEYKWKQMCAYIVDRGALLAYEEANNMTALKPLTTDIIFATKREDQNGAKSPGPRLPGSIKPESMLQPFKGNLWPILSEIILEIEGASSCCWDGGAKDASLTQLLSQAVLQDDTQLIQCLLKHGVDFELRIGSAMSALELACSPEALISEESFSCLLSEYKSYKLIENGKKIDTLGLLYLPGDEAAWKLERLLEAGLSCNHRPDGFETLPLNWSIDKGSNLCAEILLDFGADPWQMDLDGWDAVFVAVDNGSSSLLSRIATISSERNLSTNWNRKYEFKWGNETFRGATGLHVAAADGHVECLRFYFDSNLLDDVEATDNAMQTPMHYAARYGELETVEFLKGRGGNINATDRGGFCPLHLAVQGKHIRTVRTLLSLGAESKVCNSGLTPLAYAYQTGNLALIQLLQTTRDNNASRQVLAQPKSKGLLRSMAKALRNALGRDDIEACKHLLSQGCPVDIQLDEPWPVTPLMCAICTSRRPEIVGWLIDQGARVSTVFRKERMPMSLTGLEAAAAQPMYNDLLPRIVAKYFEEKGELLSLPRSPLSSAVRNNNYVGLETLLDAVRRWSFRQNDAFDNDSSSFIRKTTHGETPLHVAAACGSLKVVELLMKGGANSFALNHYGDSPVMHACKNGRFDIMKLLSASGNWQQQVDIFESNLALLTMLRNGTTDNGVIIWDFILAQGIDPYQLNALGCSGVHYAMAHLSQTYLRLMLRRRINVVAIHNISWDVKTLNKIMSTKPCGDTTTALANITKSYHLISRCLGNQQTPVYSNSITAGEDSLLYRIASLGVVEALDNLLAVGVGLEWECCDEGTVLMIAAANGRLEAVKYLIRKGARLQYATNGIERNVISAAYGHQQVIDWLLVGRFSDQNKLTGPAIHEEGVIRAWSGVTSLPIPMKWEWRQARDESLLEYARRLQIIRKRVVVVSTHPDEGIVTEYNYR
ncbi:ankyrin repeat-containing domain protein [Xylaria sp. FL0064]|nr:ankyrin repeat-containing domain protein [Xylaria sp. FL0064]